MGRKPKALVEAISHPSTNENASPLKIEKPKLENHKKPAGIHVGKKISKDKRVIVRRSGRLQNIIRSSQNQENQTVVEQINLVESEKEDEQHDDIHEKREVEVHEERELKEHTPGLNTSKSNLEEKIDILVETVQQFKYEITENRPSTALIYKSLYMESRKKIEALTCENAQLSEHLEIALLKLESYEEASEKFKMVTDTKKTNEEASCKNLSKFPDVASTTKQAKVYRERHSKAKK